MLIMWVGWEYTQTELETHFLFGAMKYFYVLSIDILF